jgi:hypothetical protein
MKTLGRGQRKGDRKPVADETSKRPVAVARLKVKVYRNGKQVQIVFSS